MRHLTFDEWEAEQRAQYASWDTAVSGLLRLHGPPRKIRLIGDENLEEAFVRFVKGQKGFAIRQLRRGLSDHALWAEAQRRGEVVLSGDTDFWNDRLYPLRDCPGLLLLSGSNEVDRTLAFANTVHQWDLPRRFRLVPGFFLGLKIHGRTDGTIGKFWSEGDIIQIET